MTNSVNIETEKGRLESIKWFKSCRIALQNALGKCHTADSVPLTVLSDGCDKNLKYLDKGHEWNFGFEGGGWNSIWAKTKERAIQLAKEEYNESEQRFHSEENGGGAIKLMKVNEKSFRLATEADTQMLMSSFY